MTVVSHIQKNTTTEIEGDWDTAIDLCQSVITTSTIEFKVEDVWCQFEIKTIQSTYKSYVENEDTGGYGPGMEEYPDKSKNNTYTKFEAGIGEGFSFDPATDPLYQQLMDTEDGDVVLDLYVPMKHYRCVSDYRWSNTLYDILNKDKYPVN